MVLRCIPPFDKQKLCQLLDLIPSKQVKYISVKVCPFKLNVEPHHLTPSIYLISDEYRVSGLETINEVKTLIDEGILQILKISINLDKDDTKITIDCLGHSVTQRSEAASDRPLTMRLLDAKGLLGSAGITEFTDVIV